MFVGKVVSRMFVNTDAVNYSKVYSDKWHGVQEYSLEHWALKKRFKPFRYLLSQAENAGLHWNCLLERNFSWAIKFWVRV